jgi:uncharacterized membrane protein YciS (DUF1049 family)
MMMIIIIIIIIIIITIKSRLAATEDKNITFLYNTAIY